MGNSLAQSTIKTYNSGWKSYRVFCGQLSRPFLPLLEDTLTLFCTVSSRRVGFKTIKVYLAGIQYHSIMAGYNEHINSMHSLYYLLRGIRRTQGNNHSRPSRDPITVTQLHQLLDYIKRQFGRFDATMLSSAVTLAFFGLLRVSEYTSASRVGSDLNHTLCVADVSVSSSVEIAFIYLKSSKTDPFRVGVNIRIGSTGSRICPVRALFSYIQIHPSLTGPLFVFNDGRFLTREDIVNLLFRCFGSTNINTHSFRIGGASAAASAGISDSTIQILGRWSSDAYKRYLRISDASVLSWSQQMANVSAFSRLWDPNRLASLDHACSLGVIWGFLVYLFMFQYNTRGIQYARTG